MKFKPDPLISGQLPKDIWQANKIYLNLDLELQILDCVNVSASNKHPPGKDISLKASNKKSICAINYAKNMYTGTKCSCYKLILSDLESKQVYAIIPQTHDPGLQCQTSIRLKGKFFFLRGVILIPTDYLR